MSTPLRIGLIITLVLVAPILLVGIFGSNETTEVTTTASYGPVEQTISVSGYLEADQVAELGFTQPARISSILVAEGDYVEAGALLLAAGSGVLAAERQRSLTSLTQAEVAREALLNGLTLEQRLVSSTTVEQAQIAYENTVETEDARIKTAYTALLSEDLEARTLDAEENAGIPSISGSYQCLEEGSYDIEVYRSQTNSGYSLRYSGLESGTVPVSFTQPVSFGNCGLTISFTDFSEYRASDWIVQVPNTFSDSYERRLRTYELTVEQAEANKEAARYAYELARQSAAEATAAPRIEDLLSANASVAAAQADIARIDAQLSEDAIYAPFSGTVAKINYAIGETSNGSAISVIAREGFSLIARVPEIDITKIRAGLPVNATFDAAASAALEGTIVRVSPIATLIDGVSYFETTINLTERPDWFRDGLNADISIVLEKDDNALRIPNRFIINTDTGPVVLVKNNRSIATTSIEVLLQGTDGYSSITGISDSDSIVAP